MKISYLVALYQDFGGGSEPDSDVVETYLDMVGGDDFAFPVVAVNEDDLRDALPIGGGVPWKCVLDPDMVLFGCYSAHDDDEGFELLEEAIEAR